LVFWVAFIPNNPEDAGATPDNLPMAKEDIEKYRAEANSYVSPWTFQSLLKTRELWLISISLGLYMLVTVGFVSQLVPRLGELGFSQNKAIMTMSICALVGVVGSYLWGVIDQKLTTKRATVIFGVWYGIAIIMNIIPSTVTLYLSVFMVGIALGGNANWPASITSTVFGYKNFPKVYTLINPMIAVLRSFAFIVLGICLSVTGTLAGAYVVFAIMSFVAAGIAAMIDDKKYAHGTTIPHDDTADA